MAALGLARAATAGTGRPAYDPAVLLKIFIYGYLNRIASSQRLERVSGPVMRKVCSRFSVPCRQLNLFTQDGGHRRQQIQRGHSRDCNFTPGKIDRRIEQIEQSIQRYLEAVETADRTQPVEAQAKSKPWTKRLSGCTGGCASSDR